MELPDDEKVKNATQFRIFQELNVHENGYVRVEDFGKWFTQEHMAILTQAVLQSAKKPQPQKIGNGIVHGCLNPSFFEAEIQSLVNDSIPDTRDWLFDFAEAKKDASVMVLEAGAGFGKSVISASLSFRRKCLNYFFREDNKLQRTYENFIKTLVFQLLHHLESSDVNAASELRNGILRIESDTMETERLHKMLLQFLKLGGIEWVVIDALDECLNKDIQLVEKLLLNWLLDSCRVFVTARPGTLSKSFRSSAKNIALSSNQPATHSRSDSGVTIVSTIAIITGVEESTENENDLHTYFESTLWDASDRGITVLTAKAQGCFLWAKLAVNIIRDLGEEAHVTYVAHTTLQRDIAQLYFANFNNCLRLPSFYQEGIQTMLSVALAVQQPLAVAELEFVWVTDWIAQKQVKKLGQAGDTEGDRSDWQEGSKRFAQCYLYAVSRLILRSDSDGLVVVGHKLLRDLVDRHHLVRYDDALSGNLSTLYICLDLLENISRESVLKSSVLSERTGRQPHNSKLPEQFLTQYACLFWFVHAQNVLTLAINNRNSKQKSDMSALQITILDKLASTFSSDKAVHWVTMLAGLRRLDSAQAGLNFLLSLSVAPEVCCGILDVIDRFSSVILDAPEEIYRSVSIFCSKGNSAAHLFGNIKTVLDSGFCPCIVLGSSGFWSAEADTIRTSVQRPIFAAVDELVCIANETSDASVKSPSFEVWALEHHQLKNTIEIAESSYRLTEFGFAKINTDSSLMHVIAATYADSPNKLMLWIDGSVQIISAFKGKFRAIRCVSMTDTSLLVLGFQDRIFTAANISYQDSQVNLTRNDIALEGILKARVKSASIKCRFIEGALWIALLLGSNNGFVLQVLQSQKIKDEFSAFFLVWTCEADYKKT
ncbi:hypothetical protein HDU83_007859 [Entophlyctis luteolus]|nr:hypothetical protein HDU83_007859 [Entophlyctis luteolus]